MNLPLTTTHKYFSSRVFMSCVQAADHEDPYSTAELAHSYVRPWCAENSYSLLWSCFFSPLMFRRRQVYFRSWLHGLPQRVMCLPCVG